MSSRCESRTTKKYAQESSKKHLCVWKAHIYTRRGNIPFMAFSNSLRIVEEMRTNVTFCASQHPVQWCKLDPRHTLMKETITLWVCLHVFSLKSHRLSSLARLVSEECLAGVMWCSRSLEEEDVQSFFYYERKVTWRNKMHFRWGFQN